MFLLNFLLELKYIDYNNHFKSKESSYREEDMDFTDMWHSSECEKLKIILMYKSTFCYEHINIVTDTFFYLSKVIG